MNNTNNKLTGIIKTLGPGILFAGAAIGGSHLIQSTRAGANYGFSLIWLVILVLIFKYPFFEYSHRYVAATGESLLQGYKRLGRIPLLLFFISAVVVAIINAAAVTLVTAALCGNFLQIEVSPLILSFNLLIIIGLILFLGKYPLLDKIMKFMVVILAVFTIIAVTVAFGKSVETEIQLYNPEIWSAAGITFLLALMGWMPAPLDIAVWPSLWIIERKKETNHAPSKKETMIDFNIGYIGTGILALAFVSLGALIMHDSGEEFSNSGIVFASQLVGLYTTAIGSWSKIIISLIAFITMFSTTITVFDGYTRTLKVSMDLLRKDVKQLSSNMNWIVLVFLMGAALFIIGLLLSELKTMIDVATIIAFLTAPLFAILNFILITSKHVDKNFQPGLKMKILSICGILFLSGFSLVYIYFRLFN